MDKCLWFSGIAKLEYSVVQSGQVLWLLILLKNIGSI